jgi:selenide,water dikinase
MTDVTGFGLLGHTFEMARGAGVEIMIDWSTVPLLDGVAALAEAGFVTGASERNWAACSDAALLPEDFLMTDRALLTDPQTSGGLLVSCAPDAVTSVQAVFARHGFDRAAVIGSVVAATATPRIVVR